MTMRNKVLLIGLLATASLLGAAVAGEAKDQAAVAKQLPSAKVTLSQGLAASEAQGQPISAKFEVDEGHFQLSVYTAQGSAFQEVLVDYTTGKIAKAGPLDEADDLAAAKKQVAAMAKAKTSLKGATDKPEHDHPATPPVTTIHILTPHHP